MSLEMAKLTSFRETLQDRIDPEDSAWVYTVRNLPQPRVANAAGLIKSISVASSDTKQKITLSFTAAPSNRVTRGELYDRFILISFSDFRLRWPSLSESDPPRPATAKETADYITKLLITGINLNGVHYNFYGHSNSQLKARSCFLYAASKQEIATKIEGMGDLSKLKSVGKKAKRIGLLFSSANMALELPPNRCEDIEDVTKDDYIFTDGCGLISKHLAAQLCQRRNIVYRGLRYHPSVFQIRYRGYKGVLTLDPTLKGQILVQFRNSMRKFKDAPDYSFAVVDYSKPYAFGYLNDEVIVLLHTLGVSQDTLLKKQMEHLQWLQNVNNGDCRAAFQFLSYYDRLDLAEKLLFQGVESVLSTMQGLVKQEFSRMLNKRDEQRCRILIPKSRLLFGVCDPHSKGGRSGKLKEGECFVRITLDGDGKPRTITNTEVLVTRNPCLHPGDLQKFRAVDVPELAHLADCIVFPTVGKRPSADLMSGGDLDGDKFFVTWDPEIIPQTVSMPAAYPGVKEPVKVKEAAITADDRAEYFARYTNASLGRVKNLYLKWARLTNAMSPQCQQLNRLFSQCVDGNRIKIPNDLLDPPEPSESSPPFILDALHKASPESIERLRATNPHTYMDSHSDILDLLLSRDKIAISEFELLQIALRWCREHSENILEYAHFFDFSALSDEQQIWFLNHLPVSATTPSLVRNGLLQSELVESGELARFGLDHPKLHWKPVFRSSSDRMGRFISTVCRTLEVFHKKLIVMRVDERLTLALYIPQRVERCSEVQVDTSVRVFALPRSQGPYPPNYRVLPTKVGYRLYCDENRLQLYQRKQSNTWIALMCSPLNDSSYRNESNRGNRRRKKERTVEEGINYDCRISVALDKISGDIQRHVGRLNQAAVLGAEIYVISNRDVKSMNYLDQWLQYVETEDVLPLFEKEELEYRLPKLDNVNWEDYSANVVMVVRDRSLAHLKQIDAMADIQTIFQLLLGHDEKAYLREVYTHLLNLEACGSLSCNSEALASMQLGFLLQAPYLIPTFLQSQTWRKHKENLEYELERHGPALLSQLVLAANDLKDFIRQPFSLLLTELRQITLQSFSELVELVALSVRSPETALDLLIEILEPETSRLLVGRPTAKNQFVKSLYGITLDHIDEASSIRKAEPGTIKLSVCAVEEGYTIVKCTLRIDSEMRNTLKIGDHVRLTVSNPPQNASWAKPYSMDALVVKTDTGSASFRCLHTPPPYIDQCAWVLMHCGTFVTSKTMIDAVTTFYTERESACKIFVSLAGLPAAEQIRHPGVELPVTPDSTLNESQNAALAAAMSHSLTFVWGPPGTGKTHTVVVILIQLLNALPESRVLVAAPTHNAVDNMLRRFIADGGKQKTGATPLRVSNSFNKVAPDLREYTCDAMVGKDINDDFPARRQAQKRIKQSRLVFTTCAGAGLGLLRSESFGVVLVDEASQQTEPATLIPLVKGCSRAILVGDHVQLRATVQKNAVLTGFDISLFERHYGITEPRKGVAKVMLDTQYRMHRDICAFSSVEFYEGRLRTAVPDHERPIPVSNFPWPEKSRMVWVECATPEDLGRQSKANAGQVELCKCVLALLSTISTAGSPTGDSMPVRPMPSIAVLTPYSRQKELLQSSLSSNFEVNSIDGFQGREADIVIFVIVRCNVHCEIGFLTDMRRLNVVMTRAKRGVILLGHKATLTGVGTVDGSGGIGEHDGQSKLVWKRLIDRCAVFDGSTLQAQNAHSE